MIIELVGLPGAGKTTFANALSDAGASVVKVTKKSALVWKAFLFFISYPILSIRLIDWVVRRAPRGMRYSMFMNGFVVYGANYIEAQHRARKSGVVAVLDQGHAQLFISLGSMPLHLLHDLPKPDLLVIVNAPDSLRKERMQERGRQPRSEFGAETAETWDARASGNMLDFSVKFKAAYPHVAEQDGTMSAEEAAKALLEQWNFPSGVHVKAKAQQVHSASLKHELKALVRSIVKTVSLGFAALLSCGKDLFQSKHEPEVSVLMYHSVGYSGWKHAITPHNFKKQMKYLRNKRTPVPLKHIVRYAKGESVIPVHAVAVTFDDGYQDFVKMALPILKKYQIPATLFLSSDLSAQTDHLGLPRLSEEDLQTILESKLVTIESHGRTHRHFPKLSEAELRDELTGSLDDIEHMTKIRPTYFAYPFGDRSEEVERAVKDAGYDAAFAISEGLIHSGDDLIRLKRVQVDATMSFFLFRLRLTRAIEMNRMLVDRLRATLSA